MNLVVRKCNNLFFYFFCYCMYGLRLRNFAFFKGFLYVLFRSRSLSRLPNSVVFFVKRKKKGNSPLSILHARAVSLLALYVSFLPRFHLIVFFLLSTDLVRITTRRVTFTVRHSFSSARSTHASPVRREVIYLRGGRGSSRRCAPPHQARLYVAPSKFTVFYFLQVGEGAASLTNGDRASLDGGSLRFNRFETVC